MNVFVETNFVLELSLEQDQNDSCQALLALAEGRAITLLLPAYSLIEPYENFTRRFRERRDLHKRISGELTQLRRSSAFASRVAAAEELLNGLIESIDRATKLVDEVRARLCSTATIIPLDAAILQKASMVQAQHAMSPQDSVVYASVRSVLEANAATPSCFASRDSKGFDDPDIVSELDALNCKYLPRFDSARAYVESKIRNES